MFKTIQGLKTYLNSQIQILNAFWSGLLTVWRGGGVSNCPPSSFLFVIQHLIRFRKALGLYFNNLEKNVKNVLRNLVIKQKMCKKLRKLQ